MIIFYALATIGATAVSAAGVTLVALLRVKVFHK